MKSSFLRVLFVVLFVCGAITVSAQKQTEGKSSVFIDYFAHPSNVKDSWAEALRSKVIEGSRRPIAFLSLTLMQKTL